MRTVGTNEIDYYRNEYYCGDVINPYYERRKSSFNLFSDPVDCKFGPWSDGYCSATCGSSAFRTKTREIVVKASNGGKECDGSIETLEKCDLKPCPSKGLISSHILGSFNEPF